MILRLLHPQGIAGLIVAAVLAALLLAQKAETQRWRKQSGRLELLYRGEQAAFARTVAEHRGAAEVARAADKAAAERVRAEQAAISERTYDEYEARLADARARAAKFASGRVRLEASGGATDPGAGRKAPMPELSAAPGRAAQAADEDRFPHADRLIATEQAIQLDELIQWVKAQASVSAER